jgi:phosphoribosyl 1,2-cyclic phosphate phosphodiesterase
MRNQLLDAGTARLDGVFFTHAHADHVHGIDDLRMVARNNRRRIDVHYDEHTGRMLHRRFGYCFESPRGSSYPAILNGHQIWPMVPITVEGGGGPIRVLPFEQDHGDITSLGLRFGGIAYSSDLVDLPERSLAALTDLDIWIVDALRYARHPSHFNVDDALRWIERLQPRRAVLTNMFVDLDYETLKAELPDHVEPAYDGMVLQASTAFPATLVEAV